MVLTAGLNGLKSGTNHSSVISESCVSGAGVISCEATLCSGFVWIIPLKAFYRSGDSVSSVSVLQLRQLRHARLRRPLRWTLAPEDRRRAAPKRRANEKRRGLSRKMRISGLELKLNRVSLAACTKFGHVLRRGERINQHCAGETHISSFMQFADEMLFQMKIFSHCSITSKNVASRNYQTFLLLLPHFVLSFFITPLDWFKPHWDHLRGLNVSVRFRSRFIYIYRLPRTLIHFNCFDRTTS